MMIRGTKSKTRILLSATIFFIGLLILDITYYLAYENRFFNNFLFWIAILLCILSTFSILLYNNLSNYIKIVFLFLFGYIIYLPHILGSLNFFRMWDELLHSQLTFLIYESGTLGFNTTLPLAFKYYPGFNFLILFSKIVTGITIYHSSIIVVGFIHSLILIFLYLFILEITSNSKIAIYGSFLYTANVSFSFFDTNASYESLALPLLILFLYLSYGGISQINAGWAYILSYIIVLFAIVITHHLTSYILFFIIVTLFLINTLQLQFNKICVEYKLNNLVILIAAIIAGWVLYVATATLNYYDGIFAGSLAHAFTLETFAEVGQNVLSLSSKESYPFFELFIRSYIYLPLCFTFFSIGTYLILRKRLYNISSYIYMFIFLGAIFFGNFFISVFTYNKELGRFCTFEFLGLAIIMAFALNMLIDREIFNSKKLNQLSSIVSIIGVIFILIGGIGMGTIPPYRMPGTISPHAIGMQTLTEDNFNACDWLQEYAGRYNRIATDYASSLLYTNYGIQYARRDGASVVFYPRSVDQNVSNYMKSLNITYLVIDKRLTKLPPEVGYYFDIDEMNNRANIHYSSERVLPRECLEKFDTTIFLSKYYNNGNISIDYVCKTLL